MTKLELAIAYDVEHDLFHSQNVFSDEYITPTFIKYVEELEEENAQLKKDYEETETLLEKQIEATLKLDKENTELKEKLDIITKNAEPAGRALVDMVKREVEKAEQGKENN